MNITQKKAAARLGAIMKLNIADIATQTDTAEFVIPMNIEGETFYVGAVFTVKDTKGTKETANRAARPGWTMESALAAFEQKKVDAAAKEAAKEAKESKTNATAE